ncbi:glutathione S-transferase [Schizophyllum commune]
MSTILLTRRWALVGRTQVPPDIIGTRAMSIYARFLACSSQPRLSLSHPPSRKQRTMTTQLDIGTRVQTDEDGSFVRPASSFRNFIEKGGKFAPERDRYHLYVSYACPWATRALIVRKLKGLEDIIPFTAVSPRMGKDGWPFRREDDEESIFPAADADPLYQSAHVKDLYFRADPNFSGRFTVPVLWDKKLHTIVNNESSEIIRIFNSEFNDLLPPEKAALDFYPTELRSRIDEVNEWVYHQINNGVYRTGFATTQAAYEKAVNEVFDGLDKVEKILSKSEYLAGDKLTEADIRLWVTIVYPLRPRLCWSLQVQLPHNPGWISGH